MAMDPVQQLIEADAIKRLKARYFRCLDTKDRDGWLGVFTEDVVLTFDTAVSTGGQDGRPATLAGKQAVADFVTRDLATAQTVHQGHTPEIDFVSDTEARGIWAMEDIVDHGDNLMAGHGHYRETYRKQDGEWRIASVHLTRIRLSQVLKDQIRL
jgi:uncharacterized protein (TIGR02246 family)